MNQILFFNNIALDFIDFSLPSFLNFFFILLVHILVIYYYKTITPNFRTLKQQTFMTSHTFRESGIQEWLSWRFWLRVSQKTVIKVSAGVAVIEM